MTDLEKVARMALEAGMEQDGDNFFSPMYEEMDVHISHLERFAALITAAEREACAKVCDLVGYHHEVQQGSELAFDLAAAIRARNIK